MSDCIFCKIAKKEIPATVVYEDDTVIAFNDLEPQAPVHVLVIPKAHVASVAELKAEHKDVIAHIMVDVIPKLAQDLNIAEGFRVVTNIGEDGGQTVFHLHIHLLGGRKFEWPPG